MELSIWFSPKSMLLSIRFSPILKYLVIYTLHNIHSDACLHSLLSQLNDMDPEPHAYTDTLTYSNKYV